MTEYIELDYSHLNAKQFDGIKFVAVGKERKEIERKDFENKLIYVKK